MVRAPPSWVFSPTEASAPQPFFSAGTTLSSAVAPLVNERAASLSQRSPSAPFSQQPITRSRAHAAILHCFYLGRRRLGRINTFR